VIRVHILDNCEFSDGGDDVFVCEDIDANVQMFDRYRLGEMCHGSGERSKWVGLGLQPKDEWDEIPPGGRRSDLLVEHLLSKAHLNH
jgi:hypothetical protein